jgi:formylglycine-generating enzyme required for sulfatase activity
MALLLLYLAKRKLFMIYRENKKLASLSVGFSILASVWCTQSIAGFGENLGDLGVLPPEVLLHVVEAGEFSAKNLSNMQLACHDLKDLSDKALATLKVQQDLMKLTGPMIELNAGTFVMGPEPGEPNPSNNEKRMPVTINHDFEQGKYPVTQGQVKLVYPELLEQLKSYVHTNGYDSKKWLSDDRPMVYMNGTERAELAKRLNERRNQIWQEYWTKFRGGNIAPRLKQLRLCTEAEREYATTQPLSHPEAMTLDSGEEVQIHAKHRRYPGATDNGRGLPSQKNWIDGPLPVNDPSFSESDRGFKGLSRGVGEVTSTPYSPDPSQKSPNGSRVVIRGSDWSSLVLNCRSASRGIGGLGNRDGADGVRFCAE